ncbi:MAG: UxaA family hydrolase [Lachnospiraceae bacterium]
MKEDGFSQNVEILDIEEVDTYHKLPPGKRSVYHDDMFMGYRRTDGSVGVRNEIWIIPTVNCVNPMIMKLEQEARAMVQGTVESIRSFPHPLGCSQLGHDLDNTQKILVNLIRHPNAAGVLVVGLGCETNQISKICDVLGEYDSNRVLFLQIRDFEDEISAGLQMIEQLCAYSAQFQRSPVSCSELVIGIKGGRADGRVILGHCPPLQHLAANLIKKGGTAILTEVPEIASIDFFPDKTNFANIAPISDDNKDIVCIRDVLTYGDPIKYKGLNILSSPANDPIAATALAASGAHIILFATGGGSPFSAPVPVFKISSSIGFQYKNKSWFDYQLCTEEKHSDTYIADELYTYILDIASGEHVKAEDNHYTELAIWKQGVTL